MAIAKYRSTRTVSLVGCSDAVQTQIDTLAGKYRTAGTVLRIGFGLANENNFKREQSRTIWCVSKSSSRSSRAAQMCVQRVFVRVNLRITRSVSATFLKVWFVYKESEITASFENVLLELSGVVSVSICEHAIFRKFSVNLKVHEQFECLIEWLPHTDPTASHRLRCSQQISRIVHSSTRVLLTPKCN